MAASLYMSLVDNTSDAGFRAWGKAISDKFTALGFPKSADTGQIDWATVARPGTTNTAAGYEIRYMNDALHGTAPIYVKLEYGNHAAGVTYATFWITVGTGSNGSGTITGGAAVSTRTFITQFSGQWLSTAYGVSAISVTGGFVGFGWHAGANANGNSFFTLQRTVDATGAWTGVGYVLIYPGGTASATAQAGTFSPAAALNSTAYYQRPYGVADLMTASGAQVLPTSGVHAGRILKNVGTVICATADIGQYSVFPATPVGTTPRNYMMPGTSAKVSSTEAVCMLWEP